MMIVAVSAEDSAVLVAIAGLAGAIVTQGINWLVTRRKSEEGAEARLWERIRELEQTSRKDRAEYAEKLGKLEGRIETLEKMLEHARDDAAAWREKYIRASSRIRTLLAEIRRPGETTRGLVERIEEEQAAADAEVS
jgi:DNA-binding FrmR family transcriptional regulator